jgi:hypothetical protein
MIEHPTTLVVTLHHAPGTEDLEHQCEPRWSVTCSMCQRTIVYCLLARNLMKSLLDHTWRCQPCETSS